jgi:predicted PolB exonuclease-like 3'-5' exonuclease
MLKRNIPERVWVFDIEWVPDAEAARRLYNLPPETTELQAIERLWTERGATEAKPRPFLKYLYSRIVSIAFLSRRIIVESGVRKISFHLKSFPEIPVSPDAVEESRIISEFLDLVGRAKPQLVGYNSHESDLQVLIQRGLVHELTSPMFCKRPESKWDPHYFARWDNEDHLDLMKLFSNGAMSPRLDELAKLCSLPGKMDMNGDHVVDLWLARDLDRIVAYNQIDVLNTYLIWLRLVHFCGKIEEEQYITELDEFRSFLGTEAAKLGNEHVGEFLERWEI